MALQKCHHCGAVPCKRSGAGASCRKSRSSFEVSSKKGHGSCWPGTERRVPKSHSATCTSSPSGTKGRGVTFILNTCSPASCLIHLVTVSSLSSSCLCLVFIWSLSCPCLDCIPALAGSSSHLCPALVLSSSYHPPIRFGPCLAFQISVLITVLQLL